jgi:hypothetical protein
MRCWQDGGPTLQELSSLGPVVYKKGEPHKIIFLLKAYLVFAMKVFVLFGCLIFVKDMYKHEIITQLRGNLIILIETYFSSTVFPFPCVDFLKRGENLSNFDGQVRARFLNGFSCV